MMQLGAEDLRIWNLGGCLVVPLEPPLIDLTENLNSKVWSSNESKEPI